MPGTRQNKLIYVRTTFHDDFLLATNNLVTGVDENVARTLSESVGNPDANFTPEAHSMKNLRPLRFSSILSTAVTMSAAFAHLMEMPAKMRYEPSLYVRLHRTLYPNFGRIAGIAEIVAVVTTGVLALWDGERGSKALPLTASAAGSLAAAHGAYWLWVQPANRTMASWPLEAIPPLWYRWRDRWEYTHAARALLVTGALAALVSSVLQSERGRC